MRANASHQLACEIAAAIDCARGARMGRRRFESSTKSRVRTKIRGIDVGAVYSSVDSHVE